MSERPHVTIYTDGSHDAADNIGGWAAILQYERDTRRGMIIKEMSGGERDTTNTRMEMLAIIKALDALKYPCSVSLYCDYLPLVTAMQMGTARQWRVRGWVKAKQGNKSVTARRVKHVDLWTHLLRLDDRHLIEWVWVEAHSDVPPNMRADRLAKRAMWDTRRQVQASEQ